MGRGLGHVTPGIFGKPSSISPKLVKPESSKSVHIFILVLPTGVYNSISERVRSLGHVTPRIFGIPSSVSPKPVKPESSKLLHSFILALPTRLKDNSERAWPRP